MILINDAKPDIPIVHPDSLRQLISNCRKSSTRFLGHPRDWSPHKIFNPEMPVGYVFSEPAAWEYMANHLAAGLPYEVIELNEPPGALAVAMTAKLPGHSQNLYMKIQIGTNNKAIGRSFHLSERY